MRKDNPVLPVTKHLLTKDEFYDVYRQFFPDTTREQFELDWRVFQACKAEHQKLKALQ